MSITPYSKSWQLLDVPIRVWLLLVTGTFVAFSSLRFADGFDTMTFLDAFFQFFRAGSVGLLLERQLFKGDLPCI